MMFSLLVPASCLSCAIGVVRTGRLSTGAGAILKCPLGTSWIWFFNRLLVVGNISPDIVLPDNPEPPPFRIHALCLRNSCGVLYYREYRVHNPAIRFIPVQHKHSTRLHPSIRPYAYHICAEVYRFVPPRGLGYNFLCKWLFWEGFVCYDWVSCRRDGSLYPCDIAWRWRYSRVECEVRFRLKEWDCCYFLLYWGCWACRVGVELWCLTIVVGVSLLGLWNGLCHVRSPHRIESTWMYINRLRYLSPAHHGRIFVEISYQLNRESKGILVIIFNQSAADKMVQYKSTTSTLRRTMAW